MNTMPRLLSALLGLALVAGCAAPSREAPAGAEVDLAKMASAERRSEKIGVPADVRYALTGGDAGMPLDLQIAVIPRIDGDDLRIEFPSTPGVSVAKSATAHVFGKASASAPYRLSLDLATDAQAPDRLPVIVSMKVGEARYFSVFAIPLRAATGTR